MRRRTGVAVGGAVGTGCRLAVGLLPEPGGFPWPTLIVNVTGAGLLGFVVVWLVARRRPTWLAAVGTGVLGAYTTFSAFAVETLRLAEDTVPLALAYVVASLVAGLAAAALGMRLGRRMVTP